MEFESQTKGPMVWLSALTAGAAGLSCAAAPFLVGLVILLTAVFGYFASTHLAVDTRTDRLLDPNLAWRAEEKILNDAFPQNNHVLAVVVTGATPEIADAAGLKLAQALKQDPAEFPMVNDTAGSAFLRANGLLFLDTPEVQDVADQLIGAQGLLGTLIADPSLNGLFSALNLALEGVGRGSIEIGSIEKPLQSIAKTLEPTVNGQPAFLSWRTMLTGLDPNPIELHHIITVRPKLDYESLTPGAEASAKIRKLAAGLGITPENGARLRLTGDVALDDEEFSSVEQGMGVASLLSFGLVLVILFLAVRSFKAIFAIVVTLVVGLIWSLAFAAFSVRTLNLVSVAFIVMFIGIAVDFGIQYCIRYRDKSQGVEDLGRAGRRTARSIGGSLLLAAVTTAVGFLAFLPTGYRGVSELGIVAGAGMVIALTLNITLLPALLKLVQWRPRPEGNRLFATPSADRWIVARRGAILKVMMGLVTISALTLFWLRFDFDPIHLKNPNSESVETLRDITKAGAAGPNVMELLTTDRAQVPVLTQKLESLPEVASVTSIDTFIPKDQKKKMAIIADAAQLILPSYDLAGLTDPADDAATIATIKETAKRLRGLPGASAAPFAHLADLLERAVAGPSPDLGRLRRALLSGLDTMLSALHLMLQPTGATEATMPADFKADWISKDGQYHLVIMPKDQSGNPSALIRFINAVRAVAPEANGPAYFVQEAGKVVWTSFSQAFAYAFVGVTIILFIALARLLDVALVVGPLIFSALLTLATSIVIGLPLNFANVIALPLLMGIGVAFNIYFVANWRAGQRHPLQSSTARAVLLSAMTTLTAFGSLSLSPHAGTASMGKLLTLSLAFTLLSALVFLPALLAQFQQDPEEGLATSSPGA
jgi:uncharacterized protein